MKELTQEQSKVEVKGLEAKFYDAFLNIITFGSYSSFIKHAIRDLELSEGERVLDFGSGTGRNDCLMLKYVKEKGAVTGVDIGEEMMSQFKKNCSFSNTSLIEHRIDEPLEIEGEYDMVFTSFVLHGFVQERREIIIDNAFRALKEKGRFAVLDYNEFDIDSSSWFVKLLIRKAECPLAEDFIRRDLKALLKEKGFSSFKEHHYYREHLRLLIAYI